MNEHRTLIFYGDERDQHGMPVPFHRYEVFAATWLTKNGAVASVLTVTDGSPKPASPHFPTMNGGTEKALELAQAALKAMHEGLKVSIA